MSRARLWRQRLAVLEKAWQAERASGGRVIVTTLATLHILSGRHAGAFQKLGSGEVSIGSSLDAGIVLTDPSIAPLHARLSCGRFSLELKADDTRIASGGQMAEPGATIKIAYPARFTLGDVEAECVSYLGSGVLPDLSPRVAIAGAIGILLILGASVAIPALDRRGSRERYLYDTAGGVLTEASQQAGKGSLASPKPETVQAAAFALRQRLVSAGLQTIEVSAEDGIVRARGAVTQDGESGWRAIQVWFDGSFGQHVMLQPEVAVSVARVPNAPIGIQAVWTGKRPYLIDDHGTKFFEGSLLKDRWVLEKIENNRVILRRNDEVLNLKL